MKHFLSNRDLHSETPQNYESIIFGAGCFWGVERKFWELDGVWLTSVGYSGGQLEDPSYEIVCSGEDQKDAQHKFTQNAPVKIPRSLI